MLYNCLSTACVSKSSLQKWGSIFDLATFPVGDQHELSTGWGFSIKEDSEHLENFNPPLNKWFEGDARFSAVGLTSGCTQRNVTRLLLDWANKQYVHWHDSHKNSPSNTEVQRHINHLNLALLFVFHSPTGFCIRMCDMPNIQFPGVITKSQTCSLF